MLTQSRPVGRCGPSDGAVSTAPAVQKQIDRLEILSTGGGGLGLDRMTRLLGRLGHPEKRLPPVFHVAGTNGKGSTCAFLRAALEAEGHEVHVYTSPHLVRFNERIRIAGKLIDDDSLARLLEEVLDAAGGIGLSFFEATTAVAFLAFSRNPAGACIVEVGLGGRLDATNVIPAPAATGIAQLGLDHQAFLGDDEVSIAREKAGIAKPGVPLVTMGYEGAVAHSVAATALWKGSRLLSFGSAWHAESDGDVIRYEDVRGSLELAVPALPGRHQYLNAALATAMLRHQDIVRVGNEALRRGPSLVRWPARLQRLDRGPIRDALGGGDRDIWLDGGHNPAAAAMLTTHLSTLPATGQSSTLVLGMLASKDPVGFVSILADQFDDIHVVPIAGQDCHAPSDIVRSLSSFGIPALAHASLDSGIAAVRESKTARRIVITGSLHLAGEVLSANGQEPD